MKTKRCTNPSCRAEFPIEDAQYNSCPLCNEPIPEDDYDDYYYEDAPLPGNRKKNIIFLASGVVAAMLVVAIVIVASSGKKQPPVSHTPANMAELTSESPSPSSTFSETPEKTESPSPKMTPEPATTPEPTPKPTPEPTVEETPVQGEETSPSVSPEIAKLLEEAKDHANNGEFSLALGLLDNAMKLATTQAEKNRIKSLKVLYTKQLTRQKEIVEGQRALGEEKFFDSYCHFLKAEKILNSPLPKEVVSQMQETARKLEKCDFSSVDSKTFISIPEGTFEMGIEKQMPNESPIHRVNLSRFWMCDAEVTNEFFKLAVEKNAVKAPLRMIAGQSAWDRKGLDNIKAKHPVVGVTWTDAMSFCEWLTERDHNACDLPHFMKYTLPTEAQWEYAASGEGHNQFPWIGGKPDLFAVFRKYGEYGVEAVRGRRPNEYKLYDMGGNAAEWCSDWYAPYTKEEVSDPMGPEQGDRKVIRGGSYLASLSGIRTTSRSHLPPHFRMGFLGFRMAVVIADPSAFARAKGE